MTSIETSGKTVREAIEEGLKKLNKSLAEVEVKILSQGGLLRKAKVLITVPSNGDNDTGELNIDYLGPKRQRSEEELIERERRYKEYSQNIKIPEDTSSPIAKSGKGADRAANEQRPKKPNNKSERAIDSSESANKIRTERGNERSKIASLSEPDERRRNGNKQRGNERNDRAERGNERNAPKEARARREESYLPITDEAVQKASGFLQHVLEGMNISHALDINVTDGALALSVTCESGAAIGYRGETLAALEYLTCLSTSGNGQRYKIAVDCNGYRQKREQSLVALAERMAAKALKTGRKVVLEPMSSPSRKVIHSVLSNNDKLITKSEGNEPNRRIVIIPKRQRNNSDKPQGNEDKE